MIGPNDAHPIALRCIAAAMALLALEGTGSAQAPAFVAKPDSSAVFLSPDQTKAVASFFLEKTTESPEKLDLKVGRWLANGVERKEPPNAVLAVYPADAKSAQPAATLTVTPPGFGRYEYEVFQGAQVAFRFQVFRPGVELKFPEGKPNEPVVFREDRDTWLILENHTPQNAGKWSLRWRLRFGSQEFCGDGHDCSDPAKWPELAFSGPGERHFAAKARRSWFVDPATDKLFPETRPAALTLRFADAAGTQAGEQVLTFQSRYVATPPRDSELFWSAFRKFFYVLLGALASVFLGVSISNLRHKVALKKRLNQIATRIRNIPGIQDSEFEAGLRGKRIALENLRKQLGFVWPSYRTIIDELQPLVTSFEKRLSLVEALARQQIQADFVSKVIGQCVYSRFAAADQTLQAAAVRLRYANPSDGDLGEASQLIDKAAALLKPPSDEESAALAASLVDRIQTFAANTQPLSPLSRSSVEGLPEVAPRLSALLDTFDVVTDRHAAITEWVQRNGVAAADVEFAIAEAWADLTPVERSAVGERFKTFIAVASLAGVRSARRMVTQTRTAASRQVLLAAVKQEKVRIVVDREQPRFDEAIVLAVQFDQANLNEIAPLSGILPRWTLDSTDLDGWTVSRYIPSRGTATKQPVKVDVRVRFLDISEADGKSAQPPEISRSIEIYPVRQRTEFAWKELILFGAGFLPALVAAAWQTTEASFVPLFTLGFTADKIKEAIAGRDDSTTNT